MVIQKAEGIVIVCKLNERITKASGVTTYTWQSNKIGEISPFNNSCPSGWRELEEAKGRFLVGAGEIEEKILNSEMVDEFGNLDYSKMSTVTQKYKLGAIGGKSYIQLKEDQLPNHDHSSPNVDHVILAMDSAQGKAGNVKFKAHENVIGSVKENIRTQNSISKYDLHTNTAGSNKSHENRPSYYSVVWCISEEPDEEINASIENIGARRLHTIIEKVLDEISFTATDRGGEKIIIDKNYVTKNLGELVKDTDLSKFIL